MRKDIEIRFKREWRPARTYDDSEYTTNDKYVNGDYNKYDEESVYYEPIKNPRII